ncbi:MAG TPA: LamG-like jellyroll fold domain-containing protein [Candidatus Acidoferrum sp.]|nr:LamG-like jellyroll fold domain-containing protein [Candidatus Acidoferrum sp.]
MDNPAFLGALSTNAPAVGGGGPSPILHWAMNTEGGTGSSLTDSSGNGYTGTFSGSGITWSTTTPGAGSPYCVTNKLSSSDYIATSASSISQMATSAASMTVWFNVGVGGNVGAGFGDGTHGFYLELDSGDGFYCDVNNGSENYPYYAFATTGSWHFACITYDNTQTQANMVKLYVDGAAVALVQEGAGNPSSLPTAATLGKFYIDNYNGGPFDGNCVDDVQLFNVVLTSAQQNTIYTTGAK